MLCMSNIQLGGALTNAQRIKILVENNLYVPPKPRKKKKNDQIEVVASSNLPSGLSRAVNLGQETKSKTATKNLKHHTKDNVTSVDVCSTNKETFLLHEEVRNIYGLQAKIIRVHKKNGTYDVRCKLL